VPVAPFLFSLVLLVPLPSSLGLEILHASLSFVLEFIGNRGPFLLCPLGFFGFKVNRVVSVLDFRFLSFVPR